MLWCGHSLFLPPPTLHTKPPRPAPRPQPTAAPQSVSLALLGAGNSWWSGSPPGPQPGFLDLRRPLQMHQLTHHGCRLSSHAPGRGGRNLQGTYRWATMNQQPLRGGRGVRQRVVRRELAAHEWTGVGELRTVWNLLVCTASLSRCQPNSANGQYMQSSQNCHQPSITSVIRHYHHLSLFSLSKRASKGRHALQ
jgi:hypothetical protein